MQKSVTSFSRKGVDDRGDVSGWTETPGETPAAPQVRPIPHCYWWCRDMY